MKIDEKILDEESEYDSENEKRKEEKMKRLNMLKNKKNFSHHERNKSSLGPNSSSFTSITREQREY
jgi:hypothetical protein